MLRQAVALIGPMGVGKTTIGKKLSKKLEVTFIDTDQQIVSSYGPIPEIFQSKGEPYFRELEEQELAKALQSNAVVATGGGAVLSAINQTALKQAVVVYLATDGKHIQNRLVKGKRPLISNGLDDWRRIYDARKPIYEKLADVTVDTTGKGLKTIIDEILGKLESYE